MLYRELEQGPAVLPPEGLDILRQVAADAERWAAALRDPLGPLREQGIEFPAGTALELYEAAWDPADTTFHLAHSFPRQGDVIRREEYELVLDRGPCPPGMRPVRRLVPVEVCIRWGYVVGPPVWVPVAENSPYGRWERPVEKYCLAWYTEHVWVESCEFPELAVGLA